MGTEKLEVVITAEDQASKPIGNVKSALGGVLKTAAGFGAFVVAGAAVAGLTDQLGDCFRGAMEAEGIQAQLNSVIKSTGGVAGMTADSVNALAASLQGVTKYEDDSIVSGENLLLTFTNIGKDVFPEATKTMLDMSTALGQDMSSSAIQLGKALNDPTKGMTALSRVGVSFTMEQKEQIMAMQESGDLMGAQKVILAELSREFGGAAEAAGNTFAGKLAKLQNRLNGVKDQIGAALIPIVSGLLDKLMELGGWLRDKLEPIFANIGAAFGRLWDTIQPLIGLFGDLIGVFTGVEGAGLNFHKMLEKLVGPDIANGIVGVVKGVQGIGDAIGGKVQDALGNAGDAFKALTSGDMEGFVSNLGQLYGKITPLGLVRQGLDAIKGPLKDLTGIDISPVTDGLQRLSDVGGAALNWLSSNVLPFLRSQFQWVVDWFQTNWPLIQQTVQTVCDAIGSIVNGALAAIKLFWEEHGQQIMAIVQGVWDAIKIIVETVLQVVFGIIKAVMQAITGDWSGAWETIKGVLNTAWEGIKGIVGAALGVLGSILSLAWDGIQSLASTAWEGFKTLIGGIWDGITSNLNTTLEGLKTLLSDTWKTIEGAAKTAWDAVGSVINGIWEGVKNTFRDAVNTMIGGMNFLIRAINSIGIDIPKVELFGQTIGGGRLEFPKIPEIPLLAAGGIVTGPTVAMIGERGPEAVVPLNRDAGIIDYDRLADAIARKLGGQQIVLQLDGRTLAKALRPYTDSMVRIA